MEGSFTALYLAYSFIWAGLFIYLTFLHFKQRRIERDLAALKEEVSSNE